MSASNLIVYSKRTGVNQFLCQISSTGNDLIGACKLIEKEYKADAPFAYALVEGKEIKLFSAQSNVQLQSRTFDEILFDELGKFKTKKSITDVCSNILDRFNDQLEARIENNLLKAALESGLTRDAVKQSIKKFIKHTEAQNPEMPFK